MPERWQRELERWRDVREPAGLRARVEEGPHGDGMPPAPRKGQRVLAGVVALAMFGGAVALASGVFRGSSPAFTVPDDAAVLRLVAGDVDPEISLSYGGRSAASFTNSYCWNQSNGPQKCADVIPASPFSADAFLSVPVGTTFMLENPDGADPVALTIGEGTDPTTVPESLDTIEELSSLDPGRYVLSVVATWDGRGSNITSYFALEIVDPGSPAPTETVVVPDLYGLRDQPAMLALDDLGLRWNIWFREAPDADPWTVVAMSPDPGSEAPPDSVVRLEIATKVDPPTGTAADLACGTVAFGGPRVVVLPAGEAFVRGNTGGIKRTDKVVPATETRPDGQGGVWHVVRDGEVIAAIDYDSLDGLACRGSGVGGVPD